MTVDATAVASKAAGSPAPRWGQLFFGIICMVLIANLQYGWTLFVNPINKAHGWSIAAIQLAFSIFIALETWLTPIEGWIVDHSWRAARTQADGRLRRNHGRPRLDRRCPRAIRSRCSISARCWPASAAAPFMRPASANAVKWFPDRRGLAVGLTAAGYGAGAALTVVPIREVINSSGYEAAFFWFGLIQGGIVFILAWLLRAPDPGEMAGAGVPKVQQTTRSYTPAQALATPVFWLLYIMFVMVSASA